MTAQMQPRPQRRPRQAWTEITVRMPPDLADIIKAIARRDARTVTGLMRKLAMQCAEENERRQRAAVPELADNTSAVPAAAGTTPT
jgi:hypothetical protein